MNNKTNKTKQKMPNTSILRTTHCRFYNHRRVPRNRKSDDGKILTQPFDRVVTIAWTYNQESKMVRYGATVFIKENPDDCWNKKLHRKTAVARYNEAPVEVYVDWENVRSSEDEKIGPALDRYISEMLIYSSGVDNGNYLDLDFESDSDDESDYDSSDYENDNELYEIGKEVGYDLGYADGVLNGVIKTTTTFGLVASAWWYWV